MKVKAASFDIGSVNLGLYVEEFDTDVLERIPKVKVKKGINNLPSDAYMYQIYQVYKEGSRVLHEIVNMTQSPHECRDYKDDCVLLNACHFLDKYTPVWDTCSLFVIERQMKKNHVAQRIEKLIYSYLINRYGPFKVVTDIQASRKTQVLGAPKKMTKPQRKAWAVEEGKKVYEYRNDQKGLVDIQLSKKKDDLGDSLLQLQALKFLVYVEGRL